MEDVFYYPGMLFPMGTRTYRETGSRNKKTGKLNYYTVTRTHNNGVDSFKCSCPATDYRPYLKACKHIKRLKEKLLLH